MGRLRPLLTALAGLAAAPFAAGQVPAGTRYSFQVVPQSGGTLTANTISYTPGVQLKLDVYLYQSLGSPNFLASEGGLFSGGTRLTFGTTGQVAAAGNSVASIVPNPGFDDTGSYNRAVTSIIAEFRAPATLTGPDVDGFNRVRLGTFTLDTPGTTGTTVQAGVPSYSNANLTNGGNSIVYAATDSSVVYVLTPVAEPAGLLAAATSLMIGLKSIRWRVGRLGSC